MTLVYVIGGSGMLGSKVLEVLSKDQDIDVTYTSRYNDYDAHYLNITDRDNGASTLEFILATHNPGWIINCAGVIKPNIVENNSDSVTNAIKVNSLFPHILAEKAYKYGWKVIQIATDCVFSGEHSLYTELDPHDAYDVYGKTKSLGEVQTDDFYNIRCSVVGPEPGDRALSLYGWVQHQPQDAVISGYKTHYWNGITTKAFADVCRTIIRANMILPSILHLPPAGSVTKYDLVRMIAEHCGRNDITISAAYPEPLDRVLDTVHVDLGKVIWFATYGEVPTIESMFEDL